MPGRHHRPQRVSLRLRTRQGAMGWGSIPFPRCRCPGGGERGRENLPLHGARGGPLPAPLQVDAAGSGARPRLLSAESPGLGHPSSLWLELQSLRGPRGRHRKGTPHWASHRQGLAELWVPTQPCPGLVGAKQCCHLGLPCRRDMGPRQVPGSLGQLPPAAPGPWVGCCWPRSDHQETQLSHSCFKPLLYTGKILLALREDGVLGGTS